MKLARFVSLASAFLFAALVHAQSLIAPAIVTSPVNQAPSAGGTATFTVVATGTAPLAYQWQRNGTALAGATSASYTVANVQPAITGVYTVVVTNALGSATSSPAALGVLTTSKVIGAGTEVLADLKHANNNTYDQILLQGPAATITADPGQVTRISFIDLTNDIVQLEFSGAGTLSLLLDSATGPAAPANYNQATTYMKGHASIVIAGANDTTNVSAFSVGSITAVNQALFKSGVNYDGRADLAFLAIASANGKFGGVRMSNASFYAAKGLTGIYAPGVAFDGPVFAGDISASDTASAVLLLGSAADVRITGGDLFQVNGGVLTASGLTQLKFADGITSHGGSLPAQAVRAQVQQNGADVTAQIVVGPTLYFASLRPASAATNSTASGYATIFFNPNTNFGTINVSFSNLTSAQAGGHLVLGTPGGSGAFVFNLARGQVSDATWTFSPTGTYTTADLVAALQNGQIAVQIDSANFPSGELLGSLIRTAGSKNFAAPPAPPALPATALTAPTQTDAARFLTQATFGPTTATIAALQARGIDGWIDDQMALPATSMLAALRADITAFPLPNLDAIGGSPRYAWEANAHAAWWKMAITGSDQLRQRVAFALSEILVVGAQDDLKFNLEAKMKYYDLLVNGAFGSYRQLIEDVTLNPAMGFWLSHRGNVKANPVKGTAPDENYAREVQQLFTIGLVQLQPDGTLLLDATGQPIPTYDQTTISETAKILTGWTYAEAAANSTSESNFTRNLPGGQKYPAPLPDDQAWLVPMRYYDAFHDKTAKAIASLQQAPPGEATPTLVPANQTGPQDLKILLDTLFNHPNTGPFLSKQLIQRLVTSNPSPAYIYRVAQVFANDGTGARGNLGAVVRSILTDYEARSPAVLNNFGYGKIKEPILRVSAFLRALNAAAPNGRYLDSFFTTPVAPALLFYPSGFFTGPEFALNQAPMKSPTVFNFFSPTYAPAGAMAAAGLVAPEMEITDSNYAISVPNVLTNFMYRNVAALPPPPSGSGPSPYVLLDYAAYLPNARNNTALVDQLNLVFSANQMTTAMRTQILSTLAALPAASTDLERVQSALQFIATSPDSALQR